MCQWPSASGVRAVARRIPLPRQRLSLLWHAHDWQQVVFDRTHRISNGMQRAVRNVAHRADRIFEGFSEVDAARYRIDGLFAIFDVLENSIPACFCDLLGLHLGPTVPEQSRHASCLATTEL